ncbi:MAG: WYL domain-containing protein [Spirochaetota bacterium]|nr:WYL domain-containing protein [Spirochaetota bacterium]
MSETVNKILDVLSYIQSNKNVTIKMICKEIGVSQESIYRYINDLNNMFEIMYKTVDSERCLKKIQLVNGLGYKVVEIKDSKAISKEVKDAYLLAKKDISIVPGFDESFNKIGKRLQISDQEDQDIQIYTQTRASNLDIKVNKWFSYIYESINRKNKLKIDYINDKGEKSSRDVAPWYLYFHGGMWLLRGYCFLRNKDRTFGLDKISKIEKLSQSYDESLFGGRTPEGELQSAFGNYVAEEGESYKVRLIFDKECKNAVERKTWNPSQIIKEQEDKRIEVCFEVKGLSGIKKWIYTWLPHVEVLEPEELKELVRFDLTEALKKYH